MIRLFLFSGVLLACGPSKDEGTDSGKDSDPKTETGSETGSETGVEDLRPAWQNPLEAVDVDPSENVVRIQLEAAAFQYEVHGETIDGWAFNGQVPGPTIRVPNGALLQVELTNSMPDPTTIHWHGLHVPYDMDGVTWMRAPIGPSEVFTYEFTVDQGAGTYWYHPHYDTARQVDLGLYGMLIVEDPSEPEVDFEAIAILDSHGEHDAENPEDMNHGIEGADLSWTINGLADPVLDLPQGQTGRLRLLNVSNTGYTKLQWPAMQQIASDQGLLPDRISVDSVLLAPGDRADFEVVADQDHETLLLPYSLNGGDAFGPDLRLWSSRISEGSAEPEPKSWPFPNILPSADPGTTDVRWTFTGDPRTGQWEMNGETFPDVTIPELDLNQEAILEIRNMSPTEHPFHLHGYAFEMLSLNDIPPPYARIEDTFNVPIRGKIRLRLVADNPGDWMAHCHILPHAEGGMMTVLRVNNTGSESGQ